MYILEGINNKGELITLKRARYQNTTTERSAEILAYVWGISGAYSWYKI